MAAIKTVISTDMNVTFAPITGAFGATINARILGIDLMDTNTKKKITIGKTKLNKISKLKEKRVKTELTVDKIVSDVIDLLPRGVPLDKIKFGYVDKIITANDGNLSAAARELNIPYRTIVSWVHQYGHVAGDLEYLRK